MGDFFGVGLQSQTEDRGLSTSAEILGVVEAMRPRPCPVPLVRLGGDGDAGYLVPDDLEGIRACFSPGANNQKDFEDELALMHGIPSHMCDFSSDAYAFQTPLIEGMQTFEKKWLDVDGSDDSVSLEEWVMAHEPSEAGDLMLQMDIEGAEYRNLLATPQEIMRRFRIVVVELHGLGRGLRDSTVRHDALAPFMEKLQELFTCVHAHPNNCCGEWAIPGDSSLETARSQASESVDGVLNLLYLMKQEPAEKLAPSETERDEGLPDLAAGKPIRLSTSQGTPPHSVPHDGQPMGIKRKPFFFHTQEGIDQFATIDLQTTAELHWLIVENRSDEFQRRARFLYYVLHDDPEPALSGGQPFWFDGTFLGPEPLPSYTYLGGRRASFVTIFSPVKTHLHLSAVRVLGVPAS